LSANWYQEVTPDTTAKQTPKIGFPILLNHLTQGLTIYKNNKLLTAEDTESAEDKPIVLVLLSVTSAFSAVKILFYGQDYRFA